jgi:hypothetical protein
VALTHRNRSGHTPRRNHQTNGGEGGGVPQDLLTRLERIQDYWSVRFSKTVIITVLKSVAQKRLVKTKDFYVNCGYSDTRIWSV